MCIFWSLIAFLAGATLGLIGFALCQIGKDADDYLEDK